MHISIDLHIAAQHWESRQRWAFLFPIRTVRLNCLLELLSEEEELDLVVDRKHTSASNTTEDVSTSTLEERHAALLGNDLLQSVERRVVLNGLHRSISIC
jgi:hypothetical protein